MASKVFEWVKLLDTWSVNLNGLGRLDLILFLVSTFAGLFIWHWWSQHSKARTVCFPNPRTLQALSAFVTPTSCASISDNNTSFLKDTKNLQSCLIELDLSDLMNSICTGKAEMRDSSDLYNLFREKLCINGWHFGLLVGRNWSFRISRWIIAHQVYVFLRVRLPLSLSQAG